MFDFVCLLLGFLNEVKLQKAVLFKCGKKKKYYSDKMNVNANFYIFFCTCLKFNKPSKEHL